eukprot:COSAG02_NODE_4980_length_4757_cov_3.290253_2_plen_54_part_00
MPPEDLNLPQERVLNRFDLTAPSLPSSSLRALLATSATKVGSVVTITRPRSQL